MSKFVVGKIYQVKGFEYYKFEVIEIDDRWIRIRYLDSESPFSHGVIYAHSWAYNAAEPVIDMDKELDNV